MTSGLETKWNYSGIMRTDAKTSKKIDEASKKGKKGKVKDVKRRVEGGEVGK